MFRRQRERRQSSFPNDQRQSNNTNAASNTAPAAADDLNAEFANERDPLERIDPNTGLPPDVAPQLARAWFTRRQPEIIQQQEHLQRQQRYKNSSLTPPPPVDVDSCLSVLNNNDPKPPVSAKSKSKKKVGDSPHSGNFSSSVSVALSDKTPITSNRPLRSSPLRKQKQLYTNCRPSEISECSASDIETDDGEIHEHAACMYTNRWQGKLLFLLVFLLCLSVITVIATALVARRSSSSSSKSLSNDDNDLRGTFAPTISPAPASGVAVDEMTASSSSIADTAATVERDSPAPFNDDDVDVKEQPPSVIMNMTDDNKDDTRRTEPTATPSVDEEVLVTVSAPRTAAPVIPPLLPTQAPTLLPTKAPTRKPSLRPTEVPTMSPTLNPTRTVQPSSMPSSRPSLSLNGMVNAMKIEDVHIGTGSFGSTVALSRNGKVVLVGAPTAENEEGEASGQVQVYERTESGDSTWTLRATIQGRTADDDTGAAVAVNADGSIVAVSSPRRTNLDGNLRAGSVRIYQYNALSASYELLGQELQGFTEISFFGVGVAMNPSGLKLAIGASLYMSSPSKRFQGQMIVYEYSDEWREWLPLGSPLLGASTQDWFGSAVALYEDESTDELIVAASSPHNSKTGGHVNVYTFQDGDWVELGDGSKTLTNKESSPEPFAFIEDSFGLFLALAKYNGILRLAVGAPFKDSGDKTHVGMVVVYEFNGKKWRIIGEPIVAENANDEAGYSVKFAKDAALLVVGAPGANEGTGAVRLFRYSETEGRYMVQENIEDFPTTTALVGSAEGDEFGFSVDTAMDDTNDRLMLAVGALRNPGDNGYVALLSEDDNNNGRR